MEKDGKGNREEGNDRVRARRKMAKCMKEERKEGSRRERKDDGQEFSKVYLSMHQTRILKAAGVHEWPSAPY